MEMLETIGDKSQDYLNNWAFCENFEKPLIWIHCWSAAYSRKIEKGELLSAWTSRKDILSVLGKLVFCTGATQGSH